MAFHHHTRKVLEELDGYLEERERDRYMGSLALFTIRTLRTGIGRLLGVLRDYQRQRWEDPD